METRTHHPGNTLEKADRNELAVLLAVGDFGHLRASEIAAAAWPGRPRKMADRTIARLITKRELRAVPNSLGSRSFVLTARGADRLRAAGHDARPGHDLTSVSGPQCWHRTLASRYLIERRTDGSTAFGEYALAAGRCPIGRTGFREQTGMLPDGLVLMNTGQPGPNGGTVLLADWIEVESARKGPAQLQSMFQAIDRLGGQWLDAAQTMLLERLVLVFNSAQAHERAILRVLRRYIASRPPSQFFAENHVLPRIVLARCRIGLPLVWHGCEEISSLELLEERDAMPWP